MNMLRICRPLIERIIRISNCLCKTRASSLFDLRQVNEMPKAQQTWAFSIAPSSCGLSAELLIGR